LQSRRQNFYRAFTNTVDLQILLDITGSAAINYY
jgi:hypothetical protein